MTITIISIIFLSIGAMFGGYVYIKMLARSNKFIGTKKDFYKILIYLLFFAFIVGETLVLDMIVSKKEPFSPIRYLVGLPFILGYGYLLINIRALRKIDK
jgi:hypothetical protein